MSNTQQHIEQYYDNVEINVASGGGAQQLSTLGTTFRNYLNSTKTAPGAEDPTSVIIRTNQTISVQLNKSTNDLITVSSTDSPFEISGVKIIDMWITNNSGSTAAVRLFFQPTKY